MLQDKAQLLHFYPYLEQPFNYNCADDEWDKNFPEFSPGALTILALACQLANLLTLTVPAVQAQLLGQTVRATGLSPGFRQKAKATKEGLLTECSGGSQDDINC